MLQNILIAIDQENIWLLKESPNTIKTFQQSNGKTIRSGFTLVQLLYTTHDYMQFVYSPTQNYSIVPYSQIAHSSTSKDFTFYLKKLLQLYSMLNFEQKFKSLRRKIHSTTQTLDYCKHISTFHTFNSGHIHQNIAEQQETKSHYLSSVNISALLI